MAPRKESKKQVNHENHFNVLDFVQGELRKGWWPELSHNKVAVGESAAGSPPF